jgi:hypothetical protein
MSFNQKEYLDSVVMYIESQRNISINNIKKTDLYNKDSIYETIIWFERIIEKIKSSPPSKCLSKLVVLDALKSDELCIKYIYSDKETATFEIVFVDENNVLKQ